MPLWVGGDRGSAGTATGSNKQTNAQARHAHTPRARAHTHTLAHTHTHTHTHTHRAHTSYFIFVIWSRNNCCLKASLQCRGSHRHTPSEHTHPDVPCPLNIIGTLQKPGLHPAHDLYTTRACTRTHGTLVRTLYTSYVHTHAQLAGYNML